MMRRRVIAIVVVSLIVALGCGGLYYLDSSTNREAGRFVRGLPAGKSVNVTAHEVDSYSSTTSMILTIDGVVTDNSMIHIYGTLTIDPPMPGCKLASLNKMQATEIDVTWDCGGTLRSQYLHDLRLDEDPPGYPIWTQYDIIPTGVKKQ